MSLELAIAENTRALQALLAHLANIPAAVQVTPAEPVVEAPAPKAKKAKAVEVPAPVVEAPVVEAAPAVSRDAVMAAMANAIRAGKREEVRALLAKVGAGKVSEIPEDRLADALAAAQALLGG